MEQGKPLAESRREAANCADLIDWFAEEGRRAYGRLIPGRASNVAEMVVKEPVGPVAAFSPWNFPLNQAVRKVAAALAAGCSIILKGPEETPASCAALVAAFADAGLPAGALNLVFGDPAAISAYLIPHPSIRKISFTGSTAVGKRLAALAGAHMKRVTMELGGHAPAIVFEDADLDRAVKVLAAAKFRNAGQICVAPTRFLVHESLYRRFVDDFAAAASAIKVGDGLVDGVGMGPVAHRRRLEAMEALTADAVARGARARSRRRAHRQPRLFLRADRARRRANFRAGDERGAVRANRVGRSIPRLRGCDPRSQPPGIRTRRLRLHPVGEDDGERRPGPRERHGVDQSSRTWRCPNCRLAASRIPATALKAEAKR